MAVRLDSLQQSSKMVCSARITTETKSEETVAFIERLIYR